jgi:hypothetical protein
MRKYGYNLVHENFYGAYYEKQEPQGFTHVVCVLHKLSGRHIVQSYDQQVLQTDTKRYINEGCGVEIPVLLLMWFKFVYLSCKYRWNRKEKRPMVVYARKVETEQRAGREVQPHVVGAGIPYSPPDTVDNFQARRCSTEDCEECHFDGNDDCALSGLSREEAAAAIEAVEHKKA